MKINSIAELYSEAGCVAKERGNDEDIFVKQP